MSTTILAVALLLIATAAGLWLQVTGRRPLPMPPEVYLKALAQEIGSTGEIYGSPAINPQGSELAFTRALKGGRGVLTVNFGGGAIQQLSVSNNVSQVFAYSHGGRYLALQDECNNVKNLRIYDRQRAAVLTFGSPPGKSVTWLDDNSFCVIYDEPILRLGVVGAAGITTREINTRWIPVWIAPMTSDKVGLINNNRIWTLDLKTGETVEILPPDKMVNSGTYGFDPAWLTYSPEDDAFLFCAWDSNWRHLFRLDHRGNSWQLVRLSQESEFAYNGKWIQNGGGFAFIGNQTNHFYLAIRPADTTGNTNLFLEGHVQGYAVSADGGEVFAAGSMANEPLGLWEYTVATRCLRSIFSGGPAFATTQNIQREERWAASFDGLRIPYYWLEARNQNPTNKYPVVIAIPLPYAQCYQSWEPVSQFFANLGVFHVAVNYRGVDGYGRAYHDQDGNQAYQDVYAVYRQVIQDPRVDQKKVFLMSFSGGCRIVNQLVEHYPGLWAGVIDISGPPPSREVIERHPTKLFLFVGRQDTIQNQDELIGLDAWAQTRNIPVESFYPDGTGHVITDTDVSTELLLRLGKFIFD